MFRILMAATALTGLVALPVMAQTTNPATPAPMTQGQSAVPASSAPTLTLELGYTQMAQHHLASRLIGAPVFETSAADAEQIGDVNDLVLDDMGDIFAVVIGVGGFLGLGEKNVAVSFEELDWVSVDGKPRLVFAATREALEAAPTFEWNEDMANPMTETGMTGNGAAAPADRMTPDKPDDTTAMQPKDNAMAIDKSAMTDVDIAGLRAEELIGARVYGANDADVGEVGDLVLTGDNMVEAIIVDVGGFLGIGEKEVALPIGDAQVRRDGDNRLYVFVPYAKAELENTPAYEKQ